MTSNDGPFDPMISSPGLAPGAKPRAVDPMSQIHLNPSVANEMLRMGVSDVRRPIDRLVDRLRTPGGPEWLLDTLRLPVWSLQDDPETAIARGRLSLAALDSLKERCKLAAFSDPDSNLRLVATGGYYLAIAAAAVHHNRLITSLPQDELANALLDLGEALPEPWTGMLGRAALLLGVK